MVILAYGDALNSSDNWLQFSNDCILPVQTDIAGASNEEVIRNIMRQIQERWRGKSILRSIQHIIK